MNQWSYEKLDKIEAKIETLENIIGAVAKAPKCTEYLESIEQTLKEMQKTLDRIESKRKIDFAGLV